RPPLPRRPPRGACRGPRNRRRPSRCTLDRPSRFGRGKGVGIMSNQTALGEGLTLYTTAMRRVAEERLRTEYGERWWRDGVIKSLTRQQESTLQRDMNQQPQRPWIDFLDATHFAKVVPKTYNAAFAGIFGPYNRALSCLQQVAAARNEWAHPRSGDLP